MTFWRRDRHLDDAGRPRSVRCVRRGAWSRAFVVSSPRASTGRATELTREAHGGIPVVGQFDRVRQHAPEEDIVSIVHGIAASHADLVIAVGGASVGDAAKGAVPLAAGGSLEIEASLLCPGASPRPGQAPIVGVPATLAGAEFLAVGAFTRCGVQHFFGAPGLAHRVHLGLADAAITGILAYLVGLLCTIRYAMCSAGRSAYLMARRTARYSLTWWRQTSRPLARYRLSSPSPSIRSSGGTASRPTAPSRRASARSSR